MRQQFVDAAKHQRNGARDECSDDHTGHDQPGLTQAKRRDGDGTRLDEECQAKRRGKTGAISEMSGEKWTNGCAKSEQNPIFGPDLQPSPSLRATKSTRKIMCGTQPAAFKAYSTYSARSAARRGG